MKSNYCNNEGRSYRSVDALATVDGNNEHDVFVGRGCSHMEKEVVRPKSKCKPRHNSFRTERRYKDKVGSYTCTTMEKNRSPGEYNNCIQKKNERKFSRKNSTKNVDHSKDKKTVHGTENKKDEKPTYNSKSIYHTGRESRKLSTVAKGSANGSRALSIKNSETRFQQNQGFRANKFVTNSSLCKPNLSTAATTASESSKDSERIVVSMSSGFNVTCSAPTLSYQQQGKIIDNNSKFNIKNNAGINPAVQNFGTGMVPLFSLSDQHYRSPASASSMQDLSRLQENVRSLYAQLGTALEALLSAQVKFFHQAQASQEPARQNIDSLMQNQISVPKNSYSYSTFILPGTYREEKIGSLETNDSVVSGFILPKTYRDNLNL